MLKAMSIEDEKIEQIIEAHSETVNALKKEQSAEAEKVQQLEEQLAKVQKDLAKFDGEDVVLKSEFDKIKNEYDEYKNNVEAKEAKTAKENAFRKLLKAESIADDWNDIIVRASGQVIDSIELDKEGNIKDIEKYTQAIDNDWGKCRIKTETRGSQTATPPANNAGATTDLSKLSMADYIAARKSGKK